MPLIFATLLCFTISWATVFSIQPIEAQLKEADGVVEGIFLEEKSLLLENGKLATQMTFKINKEWGLKSNIFEMEEVIIHYPGGKLGDKFTHVEGVPRFIPGERVVVLAKNVGNRFWGLNLGLGSFKVITFNQIPVLMNTIFPEDRRVSQINLDDFEAKVRLVKSENAKSPKPTHHFSSDKLQRSPSSFDEEKNRTLASANDERENKEDQSNLGIFWLIALFAILGGVTKVIRERKA